MQHLAGIQAIGHGQGSNQLCAHCVGGFTQEAHGRTGLGADPVGQGQQAGSTGVVCCGVAQQNGFALATHERLGDGLRLRLLGIAGHRCQHASVRADGGGNVGQGLHPVGRIGQQAVGHRHGPVGRHGIQGIDLAAFACRLANALRQQRMVFAQVGADHQGALQIGQCGNRGAQPTHAAFMEEVGRAQAAVDVLAAQGARQVGREVQLFGGAVRAGQGADGVCAMGVLDLLQAIGHVLEGGLPVNGFPFAALLEHGRGQALVAVERFVGVAVAVGEPAFVDSLVFQGHDAHDAVVFHLHNQVGAGGIVRADRLATAQLPGAGAVAERLVGERAHRANVHHVARQLGVDGGADKALDLGVLATVGHAQLHGASNLLTKAHAAGAVNAPAHFFHADQRAHVFVEDHALFFFVARSRAAVTHRQVLQLALAALVANRAVQRVVDQQKFHHRLLGLDGLVGLGAHHHALRHGRGAGGHGLGRFFNIHQAHAAVGGNAQFLVIAEVRNVGAGLLSRMHDHAAFEDFNLLAVEFNFNHGDSSDQTYAGTMQVLCVMWCSNSWRKCLSMPRTGMAAASPKAQMVRPMMFSATLSSKARSLSRP